MIETMAKSAPSRNKGYFFINDKDMRFMDGLRVKIAYHF